jgi:acyl-CoA reductase-like NAD-dependent aldehyde dehydrogenase
VAIDVQARSTYERERFGPVVLVVATDSTAQSLQRFVETTRQHGAITAAVYSTSEAVLDSAREAAMDAGVALSENLTGKVYVNQTTAFSDLHGHGGEPCGQLGVCRRSVHGEQVPDRHHAAARVSAVMRPQAPRPVRPRPAPARAGAR